MGLKTNLKNRVLSDRQSYSVISSSIIVSNIKVKSKGNIVRVKQR